MFFLPDVTGLNSKSSSELHALLKVSQGFEPTPDLKIWPNDNLAEMSTEFEFLKGITTKEEKMLEKLIKLFPNSCDVLMGADLVIRSEKWQGLRERFDRYRPDGYYPETPWSYIIAVSAFGTPDNEMSTWWNTMFVLPCAGSSSSSAAQKIIGDIEGIMPGHIAGNGGSSRDGSGR